MAQVATRLVEHARLRDLAILPVPADEYLAHYDLNLVAETMVFESGHPTLVLPKATAGQSCAFDTIAIAWDGSHVAARALADARPLLAAAKSVRIVTVANKKTAAAVRSAPAVAEHLAVHGIRAVADSFAAAGRKIEEVFADYARTYAVDLIVMGGYGHSSLRYFVLGGATRSLLAAPPTALFLSH